MEMWATTFSAESPDRIVALYDREAVLWGTLRRDGGWMIVDHHSSAVPDPNLVR